MGRSISKAIAATLVALVMALCSTSPSLAFHGGFGGFHGGFGGFHGGFGGSHLGFGGFRPGFRPGFVGFHRGLHPFFRGRRSFFHRGFFRNGVWINGWWGPAVVTSAWWGEATTVAGPIGPCTTAPAPIWAMATSTSVRERPRTLSWAAWRRLPVNVNSPTRKVRAGACTDLRSSGYRRRSVLQPAALRRRRRSRNWAA